MVSSQKTTSIDMSKLPHTTHNILVPNFTFQPQILQIIQNIIVQYTEHEVQKSTQLITLLYQRSIILKKRESKENNKIVLIHTFYIQLQDPFINPFHGTPRIYSSHHSFMNYNCSGIPPVIAIFS